MSDAILVHKGRYNTIEIHMNEDVSGDTFTSEIRTHPTQEATLIATWAVAYATDGTDGILKLLMDEDASGGIEETSGYMDLKRVSSGVPYAVFDAPLEVTFVGSVTA